MTLPAHTIREANDGDRGYVIDTWLQTYRGSPFAKKLPDFAYWSRFGHVGIVEKFMQAALDNGSVYQVFVACLPSSPNYIYGWIAASAYWEGVIENKHQLLHYVFVRLENRRQGFGQLLLNHVGLGAGPIRVSHLTPEFSAGLGRGRAVQFVNPYRQEKR